MSDLCLCFGVDVASGRSMLTAGVVQTRVRARSNLCRSRSESDRNQTKALKIRQRSDGDQTSGAGLISV